jgi:hypothetical protein
LLGAMWLQLATSLGGVLDYRLCEECGEYYDSGALLPPRVGAVERLHTKARSDRRFCSNRCRMRSYRRRTESD